MNLRSLQCDYRLAAYPREEDDNMRETIINQVIDDAVDFTMRIADSNTHGYSQIVRSLYNLRNPASFDCSSLICTAFHYAFIKNGINPTPRDLGCTYTGNMLNLLQCGFEVVARNQTAHSKMRKGDIELNTVYHTALAVDGDHIVHARSSEGTGNTRDDSGNEILIQPWYLYSRGWTHRLRFTGKGLRLPSGEEATSDKMLNMTPKWVGKVTAQELNVRSWAGIEFSPIKNYPVLSKDNLVDICDSMKDSDGKKWYYIRIAGKYYGFVHSSYIQRQK